MLSALAKAKFQSRFPEEGFTLRVKCQRCGKEFSLKHVFKLNDDETLKTIEFIIGKRSAKDLNFLSANDQWLLQETICPECDFELQ